jgi:hypothetical protein
MAMQIRSSKQKGGYPLPTFKVAHNLCVCIHDILAQFLISGMKSNVFAQRIKFRGPSEASAFTGVADIFDWLESSGRTVERAAVIKTVVLPAVLSDVLQCVSEALEASCKAKLNVTFILLRKPIQESLFLLESIVIDEVDFASKLTDSPLALRGRSAGGLDPHARRIDTVLETIGEKKRFNAGYLAQLRYSKEEDGFDGICNLATHLFTQHEAIRTKSLNINFIFSDWDAKVTQWTFLYSRLPYLLVYLWRVVEHIGESIAPTHPEYLADMSRRIAALVILWEATIP